MMGLLRRRHPEQDRLDRLYAEIVAAARQPVFYLSGGVPDTFEGRFEMLALHAGLVLRRLDAFGPDGRALARDLTDTIFRFLDMTLRELGVGDFSVPKRMKRFAEAFMGRSRAYEQALTSDDADMLPSALQRNVFADAPEGDHGALAAYVRMTAAILDRTSLAAIRETALPFPDATMAFARAPA